MDKFKSFLNSYDGGTFLGMVVLIVCIFFYHSCSAQEISGHLSFISEIDFGNNDAGIYTQELGLKIDTKRLHVYAHADSTEEITFKEMYLQFEHPDFYIKVGKVPVPYGMMNLDDPSTSVFITYPRKNYNNYGLHLATKYDIIKFDGAWINEYDYAIRAKAILLDGGEVFSASYAKSDSLPADLALTNEFYYSSLFFNASNIMEWIPETGDFWTRFVIAPGVFDFFGLMAGYYHVDYFEQTLWDYDLTGDIFTYGCYIDIGYNSTLSAEWATGKSFDMPCIKAIASF